MRQVRSMWKPASAALCLAILAQSPAHALCSGASLAQDFREADVVVRARVVAELNTWNDEPSASYVTRWGTGSPVVLYGLQVEEVFKGAPGSRIRLFQERNSAAFYLDADKTYLLFLSYHHPSSSRAHEARGTMYVRHSCGQSMRWDELRPTDLAAVRALSSRQ